MNKDNIVPSFYGYDYNGETPLLKTFMDNIKDDIKAEDKSVQSAEIIDGMLHLYVSNVRGEKVDVAVPITTVSTDAYTKEEADNKFASKVGAPENMDEMIEISDAIDDLRDVHPYDESEIKQWFTK